MQTQDLLLESNVWFHSEFFIILTKAKWIANANNICHGLRLINHKLIQSLFLDWTLETVTCMCGKYLVKTF